MANEITKRPLKRSNDYFKRALKSIPLGVTSNFRYWGDDETFFIKRGKGARVWDIDDNEYIDYRLGYGPAILGYADDRVDEAARQGMEVGGVFALATELEAVVSERICKMVPAAELVRFSVSGTEAVMAALRLARGYTGKDSYVMMEGGYHGMSDAVMWDADVESMTEGQVVPDLVPQSDGIPNHVKELLYRVPLNDANALEDVLKQHSDKIGAVLIEPILGNCCSITADQDYVKAVRELCTRHDVILVVDEVKTGFRVAKGGVQELMGVEADLCTYAKAMANGYPISALAGKEEIMRKISPTGVRHGGTYCAHSVPLAAAAKTLEILDETDALQSIENYGLAMQAELSRILTARSVDHVFTGHPSMFGTLFTDKPPTNYREFKTFKAELYEEIAANMLELGILTEPDPREPWFLAEAHDDVCLKETAEKFEIALDAVLAEKNS